MQLPPDRRHGAAIWRSRGRKDHRAAWLAVILGGKLESGGRHKQTMTQAVSRLLAEAMLLSEEERGELIDRLVESLDPPEENLTPEEWEKAWEEELRLRIKEMEEGTVETISLEEMRRLIREDSDEPADP